MRRGQVVARRFRVVADRRRARTSRARGRQVERNLARVRFPPPPLSDIAQTSKAVTGAVPFRRATPAERWTNAAGIVMVVPNPDHVNVGGATSTTGLFPAIPRRASHWLLPDA